MSTEQHGCKEEGCGAPENMVDPSTGYCPSHGPGARERLREAGRKGGKATAKRMSAEGLEEGELPSLTDADAAETWCDIVGRAVVTERLSHNQAKAALRAVREWRETRDAGKASEKMERLMDAIREFDETGDPEPVLELVKG